MGFGATKHQGSSSPQGQPASLGLKAAVAAFFQLRENPLKCIQFSFFLNYIHSFVGSPLLCSPSQLHPTLMDHHHHYLVLEHFHHSHKNTACPWISCHSRFPLLSSLAATNRPSLSTALSLSDVPYRQNHTVYGLLRRAFCHLVCKSISAGACCSTSLLFMAE